MGKALSAGAINGFHEHGYHFPIRIFKQSESDNHYLSYGKFQNLAIKLLGQEQRFKVHLLAGWLGDIVRDSRILDIVEDLIGPNIMCWSTAFFAKPARSMTYVGYHQDAAISGLQPHKNIVHVWLALRPATTENGCMRILPRSHLGNVIELARSKNPGNMLLEGTQAVIEAREDEFIDLVLAAGEASLHHHRMIHGSGPNRSDDFRLGLSITYMTPATKNMIRRDSATLVRGLDEYGHFDLEKAPETDFSEAAIDAFRCAIAAPGGGT